VEVAASGEARHGLATATDLGDSYERCREIHRDRGRSYYLATALLPTHKRKHVHALYGFTRRADDLVDTPAPVQAAARSLDEWRTAFHRALDGEPTADPLLPAVVDTVRTYQLELADFDAFLASMEMDLTITSYQTYGDLLRYMEGSSAVIGTMLVPILGLVQGADLAAARESARELGYAFQLTNFVRDVREDLDRGRVYLPAQDMERFGVTRATLAADAARGDSSSAVRHLIQFECERALTHYTAARAGLPLLAPRSRVCIRTAFLLYGGILNEIARTGYDVMRGRAAVPRSRRARLVVRALIRNQFEAELRRWGR
jgi:15-cis-phytoene synthase